MHRASITHQEAEALSRLETTGDDKTPLDDDLRLLLVAKEEHMLYAIYFYDGWSEQVPMDGPYETVNVLADASNEPDEGNVPTAAEPLRTQALDAFCTHSANLVGTPGTLLDVDQDGFVVRSSQEDGALQMLIPAAFQNRLLYLNQDPVAAGHAGARRMYDSMRQKLYWPQMANDVDEYVPNCSSCERNPGTQYAHAKKLMLFPPVNR